MKYSVYSVCFTVLFSLFSVGCSMPGGGDNGEGAPDNFAVPDPDLGKDDPNDPDDPNNPNPNPNPTPDPSSESCATPIATTSGCSTQSGDDRLYIRGTLLTSDGAIDGGGVLVGSDGKITCVGCDCASQAAGATLIECANTAISPGMINAHDHIGWMGDDPYVANDPSLRYEHRHDWRKGDPGDGEPKVIVDGGASNDDKRWGELRFILSGATSINGSGSADGLLRNLDRSGKTEGLSIPYVKYDVFPLDDGGSGKTYTDGCNGYKKIPSASQVNGYHAYTPHIAEGINREAQNEFLCMTSTANGGNAALGANTAMVHGVGLDAQDLLVASALGMQVIWSPRSNISLYGDTAPITLYKTLGMPIALGTDWMPSGSMNIQRELACAAELNRDYYNNTFSSYDLWRMVTVDAAFTMGAEGVLGDLKVGYVADIALFAIPTSQSPYAATIGVSEDQVKLVLRGGEALYGDAELVAALESGCDAVTVCGADKQICAQREIGKSFSALKNAVGNIYPIAACGVPQNEPSCVPTRDEDETVLGSSIYTQGPSETDSDGDGILDGSDNCAHIFNPIRMLDMGVQADADGDGFGDVCDPCPTSTEDENCVPSNGNDPDGDGFNSSDDNCPFLSNEGQEDDDGDGKGNACDLCPTEANPGAQLCPISIYDIKRGEVSTSSTVSLNNMVVTAVANKSFMVQLNPDDVDYDGAGYSGIHYYVSDADKPAVGDILNISNAVVKTFGGQIQITWGTWTTLGNIAEGLAPTSASVADILGDTNNPLAGNSPYDGVLVNINPALVSNENPSPVNDDPDDGAFEFEISGGLRVDNFFGVNISAELNQSYSISGIVSYQYEYLRLLPRNSGDFELLP